MQVSSDRNTGEINHNSSHLDNLISFYKFVQVHLGRNNITICKQSKGCIDETFLVAESEWSIYGEDIWYDFQKLLLSNSKYKVMIFSRKNIDEQEQMVADMKKQVQSYRTCNGIFLFACFINGHGYEFEIFNCDEKQ